MTRTPPKAIDTLMDNLAFWIAILAVVISIAVVFLGLRAQQQKQRLQDAAAAVLAPAEPEAPIPSPFVFAEPQARDDLQQIKGIGPKLEIMLHGLGVFSFSQIASWSPEQLALVDAKLGSFTGRPERDQWQSQASLLAAGDIKAYERVHGKLGGKAAAPIAPPRADGPAA